MGLKQTIMGWWKKACAVPSAGSPLNLVFFIVNIFLPGVGTLILGIMKTDTTQIIVGLLQFFVCWAIVGWVWSIYHGYLIYKKG